MANPHRLSGLDSAFLHLEDASAAHMHVASVLVFDGVAPSHQALCEHLLNRLHLIPRYRQRLAGVPLGQGRPVWVDDPHFNAGYHVRHTALPAPGDDGQLRRLAGRLFSQRLDRAKPLWEIWLVDRLVGGRFALIAKTHHALVDGVSGVDITTVLFDTEPRPAPTAPAARPWAPRPLPSEAQLLGQALRERLTLPAEMLRGVRALGRAPRQVAADVRDRLAGVGALAWAGVNPAPPTPLNVKIGPHRRYTWVDAELERFKAIKAELGGSVNDVVLTVVTIAVGRHLRAGGQDTDGLMLRAMVPVSVRAEGERGALGNRVSAMYAPLPVGLESPRECYEAIRGAMSELKESGQAVGAQVLTQLAGFAPATILSQAARLQSRQRFFNLVVTNVPGPQFALYLLGQRLTALYPVVPLAENQALGIAVMSYDGQLGFGLLSDFDALPALDALAQLVREAIADLTADALTTSPARRSARAAGGRSRRRSRAQLSPDARPDPSATSGATPGKRGRSRRPRAPAAGPVIGR